MISDSVRNRSDLEKDLAQRDTSLLTVGTSYVYSYLAAMNNAVAPTS